MCIVVFYVFYCLVSHLRIVLQVEKVKNRFAEQFSSKDETYSDVWISCGITVHKRLSETFTWFEEFNLISPAFLQTSEHLVT
jgi:hypothetical protein